MPTHTWQKQNSAVNGFESPFGLELLATVDFLINETGNSDPHSLASARKGDMFPFEHISLAAKHLQIMRN